MWYLLIFVTRIKYLHVFWHEIPWMELMNNRKSGVGVNNPTPNKSFDDYASADVWRNRNGSIY